MEICKTADPITTEGVSREETQEGPGLPAYGPTPDAHSHPQVLTGGASANRTAQAILSQWIATDPLSARLLQEVRAIAGSGSTVLIRGEAGSGKNALTRLLHYLGPDSHEPLLRLDCAGLPAELLDVELFGRERGSRPPTRGCLELAGGGSIVLDEVAALPMPIQAKLLRVIQEKRFERVGGSYTLTVAARIIALTNVDLERAVARRSFREDLYYRLNVIPMFVPALRERPGDILPLAERFLAQLAEMHRKPRLALAPGVVSALENHSYPGNVRELRDILEHAVVLATPPEIVLADLPLHVREAAAPESRRKLSLEELERNHIAEVLDYTRGKKTLAAQILGISRKTLLEKRKRYGLE